jgi:AraC-like DNA-binding protein
MAYDLARLAERVHAQLRSNPGQPLKTIAARLQVDRHTLTRALHKHLGRTFRQLRQECLKAAAIHLFQSPEAPSAQWVARQLGYGSRRSFLRWYRRAANADPQHAKS